MKFRDIENDVIIEVTDKTRIDKLKGYPDKFEEIVEKKTEKNNKKTK